MRKPRPLLSMGARISDTVATTMGSWRFILIQSAFLLVWILVNVASPYRWDAFPFILLNLILSFQAAYSAPFIMMSQNRQEARDRDNELKDLATDMHSERLLIDIQKDLAEQRAILLDVNKVLLAQLAADLSLDVKKEIGDDQDTSKSAQKSGNRRSRRETKVSD